MRTLRLRASAKEAKNTTTDYTDFHRLKTGFSTVFNL
jgi:hypothetical protein